MTCAEMMTKDPPAARENDTVADATAALGAHRCMGLAVVDGDGRFAGMFGVYDLMSLLIPPIALAGGLMANLRFMGDDIEILRARYRDVAARRLGEVAERDVPLLHPDTTEIDALRLFCRERTTLAVVERGSNRFVGVVSYWDALRAVAG